MINVRRVMIQKISIALLVPLVLIGSCYAKEGNIWHKTGNLMTIAESKEAISGKYIKILNYRKTLDHFPNISCASPSKSISQKDWAAQFIYDVLVVLYQARRHIKFPCDLWIVVHGFDENGNPMVGTKQKAECNLRRGEVREMTICMPKGADTFELRAD